MPLKISCFFPALRSMPGRQPLVGLGVQKLHLDGGGADVVVLFGEDSVGEEPPGTMAMAAPTAGLLGVISVRAARMRRTPGPGFVHQFVGVAQRINEGLVEGVRQFFNSSA